MLSRRRVAKNKRYFFRGEEISKAKANAMVIGACAGMVMSALGIWMVCLFLSTLFEVLSA